MKTKLRVKIGMMAAALLTMAASPRPAYALEIKDRIWAPAETLKNAPTLPTTWMPIACYAKAFQGNGSSDRAVGVLPFLHWGILDAVVVGGLPPIGEGADTFENGKGLLGLGGGVSFDRVLTSMFPELGDYFSGPIPGTNGNLTFAFKAGVAGAFDLPKDAKAAFLIYVGPRINFPNL